MSVNFVFVYGSLRRGSAGAMSVRFPAATYVDDGKVSGRFYDLGAYPGLFLDGSASLVTGEVYEVDDAILQQLDQFELSSDYVRREVEVQHGTERRRCWIYVPERDADFFSGLPLIESGDWIEHVRSRQS
ncbi:MAG TPA: gamma-glutamylcyclotransferase family protein [Pyrinomonadaceae bacterium]